MNDPRFYARIFEMGTRKTLVLCDSAGLPLPQQCEIRTEQTIEGDRITVTFNIDGDEVAWWPGNAGKR